jgi:hypothetical protein
MNGYKSMDRQQDTQNEVPQSYLVPKEVSQSHDSTSTMVQVKQAQEHDEDQTSVSTESNNGADFDALHMDHHTSLLIGHPLCVELQMGQPCGFKKADKEDSPGRHLKTRTI